MKEDVISVDREHGIGLQWKLEPEILGTSSRVLSKQLIVLWGSITVMYILKQMQGEFFAYVKISHTFSRCV